MVAVAILGLLLCSAMDRTCAIHKGHGIDRDYFPAGEDLLYYGQGLFVCPASKDRDNDTAIADIEICVTERQALSCKRPFWKTTGSGIGSFMISILSP